MAVIERALGKLAFGVDIPVALVGGPFGPIGNIPEDENAYDRADEYMFGPDVLVAPVLYEGVRARELYLPKGSWININDQTQYFGGASVTADAPYEAIPVFVKQGSEAEKLLLS